MHLLTIQDWGFSNRKEHSGRREYQMSHILLACLLLPHEDSQQLKHLSFQLCLSLPYPQISTPLLVNHPRQHSQPSWSLSQVRRAKLVNLPDKDFLLGWTTRRRILDSSTEGSTRPEPPYTARPAWWHTWVGFPTFSVPLFQSLTPVPLNPLPKLITCTQILIVGSAFWGFLVQVNRGHGTTSSSYGCCTHMLTFTPRSCVHMYTIHVNWDQSGFAFFKCALSKSIVVKENEAFVLSASSGLTFRCHYSLHYNRLHQLKTKKLLT